MFSNLLWQCEKASASIGLETPRDRELGRAVGDVAHEEEVHYLAVVLLNSRWLC